jgi:hypothetical protein
MYAYTNICKYIHVCVSIFTHTLCVCLCLCYMYVDTYIYVCTYKCVCQYMYTDTVCVCVCVCVCVYIPMSLLRASRERRQVLPVNPRRSVRRLTSRATEPRLASVFSSSVHRRQFSRRESSWRRVTWPKKKRILKTQCPGTFTIQKSHCIEYFFFG